MLWPVCKELFLAPDSGRQGFDCLDDGGCWPWLAQRHHGQRKLLPWATCLADAIVEPWCASVPRSLRQLGLHGTDHPALGRGLSLKDSVASFCDLCSRCRCQELLCHNSLLLAPVHVRRQPGGRRTMECGLNFVFLSS